MNRDSILRTKLVFLPKDIMVRYYKAFVLATINQTLTQEEIFWWKFWYTLCLSWNDWDFSCLLTTLTACAYLDLQTLVCVMFIYICLWFLLSIESVINKKLAHWESINDYYHNDFNSSKESNHSRQTAKFVWSEISFFAWVFGLVLCCLKESQTCLNFDGLFGLEKIWQHSTPLIVPRLVTHSYEAFTYLPVWLKYWLRYASLVFSQQTKIIWSMFINWQSRVKWYKTESQQQGQLCYRRCWDSRFIPLNRWL